MPSGSEPRAIVLLSAGLDSTTVLAIAASQGRAIYALSFRYGQTHQSEIDAAREVADRYGVREHLIIDLPRELFRSSALVGNAPIPKQRNRSAIGSGIPDTYVPARNTVFLSMALAMAESLAADEIFIGINAVDYSGYPDCRPEYLAAFQRLANLATKQGVESGTAPRILAPLIDLTKPQIIQLGLDLGVDYSRTRTCYDPDKQGRACGSCDSCHIRLDAFASLQLVDPAPYQGRAKA